MDLARYVDALNLLGDENRLRLCALLGERDMTVTELVRVTELPQSRVSTHLGRLRDAGVVRDRRVGTNAFYSLSLEAFPPAAKALLEEATRGDDPTIASDRRRLAALDAERRGALPEAFAGEMERHYSPGRTWESLVHGMTALLDMGDVLDVGSGDGAVSGFLAPRCRSVTCIDASARMVEAASRRLASFSHARCVNADAEEMPFKDASFDVALVFHTLVYAEHPSRVVDECARVLRPGGRLVALSLDAHEPDATASYGARHAGFSPRKLGAMVSRSGFELASCEVVCREHRGAHFQVVLAVAHKPASARSRKVNPR